MGPACACGCGEYLPDGSTRNYKRGHKTRASGDWQKPESDDFFSGADTISTPDTGENPDIYTLFHAAQDTPNDPEPADLQQNAFSAPLKITASVRKDIEGKLAFMFAMTGNIVQMADPICGGVVVENSGKMAKALMPIMCQSPAVVKWFRSGSNYMMYVNFLMACAPVFGSIYAHHMVKNNMAETNLDVPHTPQFYGVQ